MKEFYWMVLVPFLFGLIAFLEPYSKGIHNKFLKKIRKLKDNKFGIELFMFLFSRILFFSLWGGLLAFFRNFLWFFIPMFGIGLVFIILSIISFIITSKYKIPTLNLFKEFRYPLGLEYAGTFPAVSLSLCIALSTFIFLAGLIGLGIFTMMLFSLISSLPILLLIFFPDLKLPEMGKNRFYIASGLIMFVGFLTMITNL